MPDEETDEVCELCGRKMVIKTGRFGKFLACPGFPECRNTKPLVEKMPGRCPKCGGAILKRKSKKGYAYYACEKGAECGFMTWDVPTAEDCPECGQTLFKKSGKGRMKPFCINEKCSRFLPEDQRGYYKKKTADTEGASAAETEEKPTAKKTTAKKTVENKGMKTIYVGKKDSGEKACENHCQGDRRQENCRKENHSEKSRFQEERGGLSHGGKSHWRGSGGL